MSEYDGRLWIVTSTFPAREECLAVARCLVSEGLTVCAQVGAELISVYLWEGSLEESAEVALALKVRSERLESCLARLHELHPYQVPQLLAWQVGRVGEAYGKWANGEQVS